MLDILHFTLKSLKTFRDYLPDPFVVGLFGMMWLAYVFPEASQSRFHLPEISQIGIWLIFFFYGLKIPMAALKANITHIRLHLAIQLTTFLIFPLLMVLLRPWLFSDDHDRWWLGFWFLAALPSTVSSSVVMVGIAKGNVPGALFNATLSGMIGVFLTPLWISGNVPTEGIGTMYGHLFLEVVLPTLIGLILQPWGGSWVQKRAKKLAWMDKMTIWIIVYLSFANTFSSSVWAGIQQMDLMYVALITLLIFLFFLLGIYLINRRMNWFDRPDEITWLLCGSKKSLVHGSVFLPILFPNQVVGMILLPLMFYHAWQLVIVSYLASYWGKKELPG